MVGSFVRVEIEEGVGICPNGLPGVRLRALWLVSGWGVCRGLLEVWKGKLEGGDEILRVFLLLAPGFVEGGYPGYDRDDHERE